MRNVPLKGLISPLKAEVDTEVDTDVLMAAGASKVSKPSIKPEHIEKLAEPIKEKVGEAKDLVKKAATGGVA